MFQKPARSLVERVEHDAGKAGFGQRRDKRDIRLRVGKEHRDEAGGCRDLGQGLDDGARCEGLGGKQADLDEIGGPARFDSGQNRRRLHGAVAGDRRDRLFAGQGINRLRKHIRRNGAERAVGRVLQIDDVGAGGACDQGFLRACHAGKKLDHPRPSS